MLDKMTVQPQGIGAVQNWISHTGVEICKMYSLGIHTVGTLEMAIHHQHEAKNIITLLQEIKLNKTSCLL
jgi:hypothetical protein